MTSRERLKPSLRRIPKPILLAAFVVIGLPVNLVQGAFIGAADAFSDWRYEFKTLLSIDRRAK